MGDQVIGIPKARPGEDLKTNLQETLWPLPAYARSPGSVAPGLREWRTGPDWMQPFSRGADDASALYQPDSTAAERQVLGIACGTRSRPPLRAGRKADPFGPESIILGPQPGRPLLPALTLRRRLRGNTFQCFARLVQLPEISERRGSALQSRSENSVGSPGPGCPIGVKKCQVQTPQMRATARSAALAQRVASSAARGLVRILPAFGPIALAKSAWPLA